MKQLLTVFCVAATSACLTETTFAMNNNMIYSQDRGGSLQPKIKSNVKRSVPVLHNKRCLVSHCIQTDPCTVYNMSYNKGGYDCKQARHNRRTCETINGKIKKFFTNCFSNCTNSCEKIEHHHHHNIDHIIPDCSNSKVISDDYIDTLCNNITYNVDVIKKIIEKQGDIGDQCDCSANAEAPVVKKIKDYIVQLKIDNKKKEGKICSFLNKNILLVEENEKMKEDLRKLQSTLELLDKECFSAILKIIAENKEIKNVIESQQILKNNKSSSNEDSSNNTDCIDTATKTAKIK